MSRQRSARDNGLDLLRAIAVLLVLALHSSICVKSMPHLLAVPLSYGWCGVELFFVLSGFLIGGQVLRDVEGGHGFGPIRRFWVRRWYRTIPLYLAVLLIYIVVKPMLGFPFRGMGWRFFFYLQNYQPLFDFVQSWSLCIEEQFYLIVPLLAFVLRGRFRTAWFWILPLLASVVFRKLALENAGRLWITPRDFAFGVAFKTHMHLDSISMGVTLAATAPVWREWKRTTRFYLAALGVATVVLSLALYGEPKMGGGNSTWLYTALALGFAGMLVGLEGTSLPAVFRTPVERLAIWSYGAYLWNSLAIRYFARWDTSLWPIGMVLFFGVSFSIAAISYRFVEMPFMRMREAALKRDHWLPVSFLS